MIATLRERWYIVLTAAILVVAGVGFLVLRDDGTKPKTVQSLPVDPQLDTGGLKLASLFTSARSEKYHAIYTSTSDAAVSGGSIDLEIWNTDGNSRVDTTLTTKEKQVVQTASFLKGKKAVSCQKVDKAEWTCKTAPTPANGDASGLVASLRGQLSGRAVVDHPDKVGDIEATCFKVAAKAGAEELDVCVDQRGVLLKLTSGSARIEIKSLDENVPNDTFEPPAAVKG